MYIVPWKIINRLSHGVYNRMFISTRWNRPMGAYVRRPGRKRTPLDCPGVPSTGRPAGHAYTRSHRRHISRLSDACSSTTRCEYKNVALLDGVDVTAVSTPRRRTSASHGRAVACKTPAKNIYERRVVRRASKLRECDRPSINQLFCILVSA